MDSSTSFHAPVRATRPQASLGAESWLALQPAPIVPKFDSSNLNNAASHLLNLGHGSDDVDDGAGASFWMRPIDGAIRPIATRVTGDTGCVSSCAGQLIATYVSPTAGPCHTVPTGR